MSAQTPASSGEQKLVAPDFELPVLPLERRRIPKASLEELLQLSRWNDPEARAHRRKLDCTPGYRCDVEFVME
jgi:hypothetical protein